jgi:hypothetical protein
VQPLQRRVDLSGVIHPEPPHIPFALFILSAEETKPASLPL